MYLHQVNKDLVFRMWERRTLACCGLFMAALAGLIVLLILENVQWISPTVALPGKYVAIALFIMGIVAALIASITRDAVRDNAQHHLDNPIHTLTILRQAHHDLAMLDDEHHSSSTIH